VKAFGLNALPPGYAIRRDKTAVPEPRPDELLR